MPISVQCGCGKVFKVRDEQAGQSVACQVCGALLTVAEAPAAVPESAPFRPATAASAVPVASDPSKAGRIPCPACAELILPEARVCPFCKEKFRNHLSADERNHVLEGIRASLRAANRGSEEALRGGMLSGKSKVLLFIELFFAVLFVWGIAGGRNAEPQLVLGIIFGILFGICVLVSLYNDHVAAHIQDADTADKAFKKYFAAIKTGRAKKAYAALVPPARKATGIELVKFTNPKFERRDARTSFSSVKEFKAYWNDVLGHKSGQTRLVTLKSANTIVTPQEDIGIVEADLEFIQYSSIIVALVLLGIIGIGLAVILYYATRSVERAKITKVMIRHDGNWYLLDGAWESELDRSFQ